MREHRMKIAVTGATGFIGRHVLTELARRDVEVIAISRHATPGAGGVQLDIQAATSDAFERIGRPDVLIHLAWGGLPHYRSLHHFEQELPAHYRFLKGLVDAGLKNLVVAGTCFEYGMQSGPLPEDMAPQPSNPYGFAKDSLRRQLEFLQQAQAFNLTWARLFYLHGEGQAKNALFPLLSQAVARGDKVFNMSGGEQLRDYLPVAEATRCLVALALKRDNTGLVNVCAGKPISIRKLVEGWIAENHWTIELNLGHYPYPDYEPMAFWGDRRKLDTLLEVE